MPLPLGTCNKIDIAKQLENILLMNVLLECNLTWHGQGQAY